MDNKKRQDDYLKKSMYEGKPKSTNDKDFSVFEHDGEFYFAMLDKKGAVALRSEGYSSDKGRDNGIESVKKNRSNADRWLISEAMSHYFLSLKAGNHQEIGKSGPFKSKTEAEAYLAFLMGKGDGKAGGVAKAASAGAAGAAIAGSAGKGRIISVKQGKVLSVNRKLVKENRKTLKETRKDPKEISRKQVGENRKQIGESRNLVNTSQKVTKYAGIGGATALAAMSFMNMDREESKGPAPIKAVAAAKVGGWWPILLLLLPLLLIPFMVVPVAAVPAPIGFNVLAAPVVTTCDCESLTNVVFDIPDGEPPKETTRLGLDPEYGNSHALSPAQFYAKLKRNYDGSQKEKNFLNGLFKQMGYENGFSDATADLFSNETIPRGINANLGGNMKHKTYYRKMMTTGKDREAFRIKAANYCDMWFMKTCGNHMYYDHNCGVDSE